jgi:hypothetical protein
MLKVCSSCNKEKSFIDFYNGYNKCKECIKESNKVYRENHIEECRQRAKTWHSENKEYKKKKSIEYYYNNKEKLIAYAIEYRNNNKEAIAEKKKIYNKLYHERKKNKQ